MTAPVIRLLETAAARITPETWCQHVLADGAGRFCGIGHLGQARLELGYDQAVAADALMELELTTCGPSFVVWNDAPTRRAEHVRMAFEQVARRLREEEADA